MKLQKAITIYTKEQFIAQAFKNASDNIGGDSELCEGCHNLIIEQDGAGQNFVHCNGGDVDDFCLQLEGVKEEADDEYEEMLYKLSFTEVA